MKCQNCKTENSDRAKFCGVCGQPLVAKTICHQCKHENPEGFTFCEECGQPLTGEKAAPAPPSAELIQPTSFASGRYQVKKFLGEGGKKKVYLAHDTVLDRDVAFALIKTEKLDETTLTRIRREARAMAKLGDHPHIMSIYDLGDHLGQPYIVLPIMAGGDVESLIQKAPDHKLPIEQATEIAKAVCEGLVFAHAKGIIHRDIKPGNVWLSGDGTVKIGDFGLAVALDLSRLTQHGMMVGTVSYMPPEQAMGGEVTAKADLYSLGAMLYEMVTGRPPFVGEDAVAIIGQHINTPPVSPTWHRADLPAVLETLILQLLEKDPNKRPASASEVLKVLESLTAGKAKQVALPEVSVPAVSSPLYRSRVFIGREAELKQLQSAFDSAMAGQGSLLMVVGEPGIGKTATCEQLATYVALRGGKTLVGHCYEKGSLSLPYLGFVEALRSYVISRDSEELKKELGTGAADVARIVSEIREKLKIKPKAGGNPEEERYRLMQAVTGFLTHAAGVQPLLVVIEDLHDADKGTIDMLTHVSRSISGARLLMVGTYRDVEVDRSHPLSAALAELRRSSSYGRILLRGLNADEVRRMMGTLVGQEITWGLAEAVHRQTEGNPLFVQEVVRYLNEEGLVQREGGLWKPKSGTLLAQSIPEGLRDVIGKRLSLLSKECNQLLSVASVIGREFALETLKNVAGMPEEIFVNALKEAVHLAILEERSQVGVIRYRFTHAFFRQTLYEELIAPRRLQLHQQVARTLENQYATRPEEHAVELAEHFSQSTDISDLKKAVSYSEMAAKRATNVYAYGEAARLLDQAIKVQKVLNPDDKAKICDLLLALCEALYLVPDIRRILDDEAPAAFDLAESLGDDLRAAKVCMAAIWAGVIHNLSYASPELVEWAVRLDRYAPDTPERAFADFILGVMKYSTGDVRSAYGILTQAYNLARRLGDQASLFLNSIGFLNFFATPHHTAERAQVAEELWTNRARSPSLSFTLWIPFYTADTFLNLGQRQHAEEIFAELRALATRMKNVNFELMSAGMDAVLALMDGRLEDVINAANNMRAAGREAGVVTFSNVLASFADTRARIYLGASLESLEHELRELAAQKPDEGESRVCLVMAHQGRKEEASEILEKNVVRRPGIGTAADEMLTWCDTLHLEASVLVGHRKAAELLLSCFSSSGLCTSGAEYTTCISRQLGGACALLERYDEARKYYDEAIKVCTEMHFRPELALTRLQLAELLLEHYPDEKKEALEHLDFAIKEFREMKMQPSLERALRQKEILKA